MLQIAIDGPSGSGKSTIAKRLADQLNITYLNTGAMYRAFTYYCLHKGVDLDDSGAVAAALDDFDLQIERHCVIVGGKEISQQIHSEEISRHVSLIAANSAVRKGMVALQQTMAADRSLVMEGRDIGSVVLPDATYKFFLTARASERAKRRYREQITRGYDVDYQKILDDIERRDYLDSTRSDSPLVAADRAIIIDSSTLTVDQVIDEMMRYIRHD